MFEFNDCYVNFHYFVVPKRLMDDLTSENLFKEEDDDDDEVLTDE